MKAPRQSKQRRLVRPAENLRQLLAGVVERPTRAEERGRRLQLFFRKNGVNMHLESRFELLVDLGETLGLRLLGLGMLGFRHRGDHLLKEPWREIPLAIIGQVSVEDLTVENKRKSLDNAWHKVSRSLYSKKIGGYDTRLSPLACELPQTGSQP